MSAFLMLIVFVGLGAIVLHDARKDFVEYNNPLTRTQIIWIGFRCLIGATTIIVSIKDYITS
ncbi:MAG: hypothetical protein AAB618_02815 [Patescibacteria group bacterium]